MNYKHFAVGALFTNCYVFWDNVSHYAFCVDPGGDTRNVQNFINSNGLELTMILLTHGHIDHIAGVNALAPYVGRNIYIDHNDANMLRHPSTELQGLLGVSCEGVEDFEEVTDGSVIDFPGYSITVIETPGHTPGSVCYLVTDTDNHSVLLTGDTLFAQSVGRTDLEGGDWLKLEASLKRLDALCKEGITVGAQDVGAGMSDVGEGSGAQGVTPSAGAGTPSVSAGAQGVTPSAGTPSAGASASSGTQVWTADMSAATTSVEAHLKVSPSTVVLPGHGISTSLAAEQDMNPYWPK